MHNTEGQPVVRRSRLTLRRPTRSTRLLAGLTSFTFLSLTYFEASLPLAEAAQKIRYYHPDALGSTNVVTDEQGRVVERTEYSPYGQTTQQSGSETVAHQFTGQRYDSETGLYHFQARYYDPQTGHFLSPDPIIQNPGDPQALNAYSYVRNNPTNLVDPTGEIFQFIIAAILAISAVATSTAIYTGIGSLVASATGHDRAALRLARISQVSAWIGTPITFIEGGGAFVVAANILASAANKAAADPVSTALAGPSFDPAQASTANLQRTLAAVGQVGVAEATTAAAFGVLGLGARAVAPFVKQAAGPSLRKFAARYGPTLGEDTIPAGRRLMVRPGAIDAPLDYTKPGETFIRVADNPAGLKFSFKSPGGAQARTYAFPEEQFRNSFGSLTTIPI